MKHIIIAAALALVPTIAGACAVQVAEYSKTGTGHDTHCATTEGKLICRDLLPGGKEYGPTFYQWNIPLEFDCDRYAVRYFKAEQSFELWSKDIIGIGHIVPSFIMKDGIVLARDWWDAEKFTNKNQPKE